MLNKTFKNVSALRCEHSKEKDVSVDAAGSQHSLIVWRFEVDNRSPPYWYHGFLRIHITRTPESVRILIEAAEQARTVSFTDCIKFWALPTNISVASWSSCEPKKRQDIRFLLFAIHSLCQPTLSTQERGLHGGQNAKLSSNGGNPLTNLENILSTIETKTLDSKN